MSDRRNAATEERKAKIADRSEETERLVLGHILANPDLFYDAMDALTIEHFTIRRHIRVWDALKRIVHAAKIPNKSLLRIYIDASDNDEKVPLPTFAAMVINEALAAKGDQPFPDLVQTVRSLGDRRLIVDRMQKAMQNFQTADPSTPIETLIDAATRSISSVAVGGSDKDLKTYEEWGHELSIRISDTFDMAGDSGYGLSPGLRGVEEVMGRLLPSKLYVLAGMSGGGKSALVRTVLESASIDGHAKGLGYGYMLSLEMTGQENAARSLSNFLGIPAQNIESVDINRAELDRILSHGMKHLQSIPVQVDQRVRLTLEDIRNRMRKAKLRHGLSIAVIDHILLIKNGPRETLNDRVAAATEEGKNLAKEFECPVIMLSQVNEEKVLMTPQLEPSTAHLFGGQQITQNSDFVGFIHRPEEAFRKKGPDSRRRESVAEHEAHLLSLAGLAYFYNGKGRGRQNGVRRELAFNGETTTFRDVR